MKYLLPLIAALALVPATARTATRPSTTIYSAPRSFLTLRSGDDTRIDLDLDNVSVRDAVKRICEKANQEYTIDDDVPATAHVSIHAQDVRLSTALDLVTQAAGIGWGTD